MRDQNNTKKIFKAQLNFLREHPSYARCGFSTLALVAPSIGLAIHDELSWSSYRTIFLADLILGSLGYLLGTAVPRCLSLSETIMDRSAYLTAFLGYGLAPLLSASRSGISSGAQYAAIGLGFSILLGSIVTLELLTFCASGTVNALSTCALTFRERDSSPSVENPLAAPRSLARAV